MSFNESTINRLFGLTDVDSEQFGVLYREPKYELILEEMTDGSVPWTRNANHEVCPSRRQGSRK